MSYQAQPPADGAQPRPRWPPRAREEPARAYQTDDPSTTAQSSSLVPWPAAQPDQVKPENGHHNMMTGPALSPLPAVSPTPVAATEGHEAAAAGLGRLIVHRATPGARKAAGQGNAEESPEPLSRTPKAVVTTGRTLGAVGYVPNDTSRKERGARARAAREPERGARRAKLEEHRRQVQSERQARKAAAYLPANGEPGPSALRSYRRLRVEPHRATSEVLSVAYPFLAEAGLGAEGVLVGRDSWSGAAFVYDPWTLYAKRLVTNPNVLLAGVIGRGKSTLAKSLTTRSIAFGRRVYVPGDPKGEWSGVSRAVGGAAIELGGTSHNRLNPLDEGPRPVGEGDNDRAAAVAQRRLALLGSLTEQALGRSLAPVEHTAVAAALETAVREAQGRHETPTMPLVVHALLEPAEAWRGSTADQLRSDGRDPGHALGRLVYGDLAGLFDGPSTVAFDANLPMMSLDLSRISGSDAVIALVMTCASAWVEAALADPSGGQRWVVYDEAWRLMRQPALLARMQSQWKLSRALGISNLMVIHRLSDLDAVGDAGSSSRNLALGLLADCSTRIIYAQERGEAAKTGAAIGLSETEIAQLPELDLGEGLWRIGERSFVVRHVCTPGEQILFDTNSRMFGFSHGFRDFEPK